MWVFFHCVFEPNRLHLPKNPGFYHWSTCFPKQFSIQKALTASAMQPPSVCYAPDVKSIINRQVFVAEVEL